MSSAVAVITFSFSWDPVRRRRQIARTTTVAGDFLVVRQRRVVGSVRHITCRLPAASTHNTAFLLFSVGSAAAICADIFNLAVKSQETHKSDVASPQIQLIIAERGSAGVVIDCSAIREPVYGYCYTGFIYGTKTTHAALTVDGKKERTSTTCTSPWTL